MKKVLKTIFVVLLVAVLAMIGYIAYNAFSNTDSKIKTDKVQTMIDKASQVELKSHDGSIVNVNDLLKDNGDGTVTPDIEAIKNLDSESLNNLANSMDESDLEALKNEAMRNPALLKDAMSLTEILK